MKRLCLLLCRNALSCQRGLLNLEARRLKEPPVRRHAVAGLKNDDVAGHKVCARNNCHFTIPEYLALRGCHCLQGLDRGLRLRLLVDAEDRVQYDNTDDDIEIRKAFTLNHGRHCRHAGRRDQNDQHRVLQLHEKAVRKALLLRGLQLVRAVFRKARASFAS